jgi:hypothetical protein
MTLGQGALRGYLTAASNAITMLTKKPCSYLDPTTLAHKRLKTLPMLGEIISQRGAWKEPLPWKEPFTIAMIDSLRPFLHKQTQHFSIQQVFLISEHAVCDWLCLGVFTGSRTSEYGQTSTAKSSLGKCYACVPNSPAAGIWANQQLAFIEADFVFYSAQAILIDQGFCLLETALNHIWELHLRFCLTLPFPNTLLSAWSLI